METDHLLSQIFLEAHPPDAAVIMERLPAEEAAALFEKIPARIAAGVLERMAPSSAADCLTQLSPDRYALIATALPVDTTAALLRHLDPEQQDRLLVQAPPDISFLLRRLLQYPDGTAGALMDPRVLAFPEDITVGEALARVHRSPRHTHYYLYVIDRQQRFVGVLNLRELMLASPKELLASVMQSDVAKISADADQMSIVSHPAWRHFHALPVVDDQGIFLGVIRHETLRRIEEQSATGRPGLGAFSTVLTLGELCWIGLTGVLADLADSMIPQGTGEKSQKETGHG
jgi:magnesium transporter